MEALLVRDTLPEALPVAVGAKLTVNVELAPAFSVRGALKPLRLNPVPDTDAFEIVRATLPVLLRVITCGSLPPTRTLPKATLPGLADNCP